MAEAKKTRAERLNALCEKVHPPFAEARFLTDADGKPQPAANGIHNWGENEAPYQIDTVTVDGVEKHRIRITHPVTGDTLGAIGDTMEEAVTKLEKRVENYQAEGV